MTSWIFEPGHTAAEFRVPHMMVTWVRGHFKNVHGRMEFDPDKPDLCSVRVAIPAGDLWTGEPDRNAHLKSADFLDVATHPQISFASTKVGRAGASHSRVAGELAIRGVTRPVTRAGFVATATINRRDFGVDWDSPLANHGSVVGGEVAIKIDVEALREKDLNKD